MASVEPNRLRIIILMLHCSIDQWQAMHN